MIIGFDYVLLALNDGNYNITIMGDSEWRKEK